MNGAAQHDMIREFTRHASLAPIVAFPVSIHARGNRCSSPMVRCLTINPPSPNWNDPLFMQQDSGSRQAKEHHIIGIGHSLADIHHLNPVFTALARICRRISRQIEESATEHPPEFSTCAIQGQGPLHSHRIRHCCSHSRSNQLVTFECR